MTRTLLIDADIVAYKFAAATETVVYFDGRDEEPCVDSDFERAMKEAEAYIGGLMEALHADTAIVCLSDPEANFRKDIWPDYKAHRQGTRKPVDLMRLKSWFAERFRCYQRPTLEADDVMGILATHPKLITGEKIIVSEDKDMQTVPGLLFNPRKDRKPRRISQLEADRYWMYQTITGDPTDGYPGAYGIGPKSKEARGVLSSLSFAEMLCNVRSAYKRSCVTRGLDVSPEELEQQLVTQARLARILRHTDYDFKARRPILWHP